MADEGILIELVLVAVLILVNGFFAAAEIAVVSASRGRMAARAEEGDRRAAAVLALKGDPDRFLATVQIGVTVVATLASALGGVAATERLEPVFAAMPAVARFAEPLAVGTVVFAIAYVSLIVGELVPKSLAIRHADAIALRVARFIRWFSRAAGPAVSVLGGSSRVLLRLMGQGGQARSPFHTLDDLRAMASEAGEQGMVQAEMIEGAISFHDRAVREVMTPRMRTTTIRSGASMSEALQIAMESGHSRFPVVESGRHAVAGLVHARELYESALRASASSIAALVREMPLVPGTRSASSLLQEMRRTRRHMVAVVDEHGAFEGVVTMEDLVEVIVGEIDDEHAPPGARVLTLAEGSVEADGSVPVYELNEEHGFRLPESADYVTVAGLVLASLGAVATGQEVVRAGSHRITVLRVEGRRIARVRIDPA